MPQEIHVVKCGGCRIYLTDIVKKSGKWSCKVCGVKQSGGEVFRGTGAECRMRTQQLNMERGLRRDQDADDMLNAIENLNRSQLEAAAETQLGMLAESATANMHNSMGGRKNWSDMLASEDGFDSTYVRDVAKARGPAFGTNSASSTEKPSKWAKFVVTTNQPYNITADEQCGVEKQHDILRSSGKALKRPLQLSSATINAKPSKWKKFTP